MAELVRSYCCFVNKAGLAGEDNTLLLYETQGFAVGCPPVFVLCLGEGFGGSGQNVVVGVTLYGQQDLAQRFQQGNVPHRVFGLWGTNHRQIAVPGCALINMDDILGKVNIFPLEGVYLTQAHAGIGKDGRAEAEALPVLPHQLQGLL